MANGKQAFAQKMMAAGVCDERGAVFCATATGLPNGDFGMVLLGVKGNTLVIHDTNMKSEVGALLYSIELKDVANLKIVSFLAELIKGYSFQFDYEGFNYQFKNCAQNKEALAVIAKEAAR